MVTMFHVILPSMFTKLIFGTLLVSMFSRIPVYIEYLCTYILFYILKLPNRLLKAGTQLPTFWKQGHHVSHHVTNHVFKSRSHDPPCFVKLYMFSPPIRVKQWCNLPTDRPSIILCISCICIPSELQILMDLIEALLYGCITARLWILDCHPGISE